MKRCRDEQHGHAARTGPRLPPSGPAPNQSLADMLKACFHPSLKFSAKWYCRGNGQSRKHLSVWFLTSAWESTPIPVSFKHSHVCAARASLGQARLPHPQEAPGLYLQARKSERGQKQGKGQWDLHEIPCPSTVPGRLCVSTDKGRLAASLWGTGTGASREGWLRPPERGGLGLLRTT